MDAARIKHAIATYQVQLVQFTIRIAGSQEIAAEIVQEAFLRLWKSDPDKVPLDLERAWLYRVCKNLAIDVLRKQGRMLATEDMDKHAAREVSQDDKELEKILAAIETLSASQREVVRLKYQHDMTYKEIAAVTGMSVNNVGVTLHNAINALKKQLQENHIKPSKLG